MTFDAVVAVVDTRDLDTNRKPIPGTGEPIPCACCGRQLSVHAHVVTLRKIDDGSFCGSLALVPGSQRVVGVSCAKGLPSANVGQSGRASYSKWNKLSGK